LFDVTYQPKGMSVDELESGLRWLFGEIYNEREFLRRKRHYMEIFKATMPGLFPHDPHALHVDALKTGM